MRFFADGLSLSSNNKKNTVEIFQNFIRIIAFVSSASAAYCDQHEYSYQLRRTGYCLTSECFNQFIPLIYQQVQ